MEDICQQRRRRQLFPMPPIRLEADQTPYTTNNFSLTKLQLDMRRKAEILKYAPNKSSSQTNNLTKSQKWAQIVSSNYNVPQPSQPPSQLPPVSSNDNPCPLDDLIPTPTSSSDIPGPIINLFNDDSIKLYNYVNPIITRTYSELETSQSIEPSKYLYSDVVYTVGVPATIASIYYRYLPNPRLYPYSLNTIPIGIRFNANIVSSSADRPNQITFTFSIPSVDLYYNTTINATNTKIVTNGLNPIIFDVSGKTGICSFSKYIGYISLSNFKISANQGNIYDIKPKFAATISGIASQFSTYSYSIIGNLSAANANISDNCRILSAATIPSPYPQFTFV